MEIDTLREFLVLADLCNYQDAAYNLSMSQSTLSKHIIKLEGELGVTLFDRGKHSIVLNKNGAILQDYAKKICKLNNECCQQLRESNDKEANLRIAFTARHGQFGLLEMLTNFCKSNPLFQVEMDEIQGNQQKTLVSTGKYDFIFTTDYDEVNENYDRRVYKSDRLVAVLPINHPLAASSSVTIGQLSEEPFVLHCVSPEMQLFETLCRNADITPNIVTKVNHSASVLQMVSQRVGVAIMSKRCTTLHTQFPVATVDLKPEVTFSNYMLCLKKNRSAAAQEFIRYVENDRD